MTASLVTIVVPCHNYGRFLADALASVTAQSYPFWECLVVDDGSTDNTADVVRAFAARDPRFKYLRCGQRGFGGARNAALSKGAGAYVQFLDADDRLEIHKLQRHVEFLETHPSVDLVYGDVRYFRDGKPDELFASLNATNVPWMPKVAGKGFPLQAALLRRNIMVISSPLTRRAAINAAGGFDEMLLGNEDWDLWLRCALKGQSFHYLEAADTRPLIRLHPTSASADRLRMLNAELALRGKWAGLLGEAGLQSINNRALAITYMRTGFCLKMKGSTWQGLAAWGHGAKRRPFHLRTWLYFLATLMPAALLKYWAAKPRIGVLLRRLA